MKKLFAMAALAALTVTSASAALVVHYTLDDDGGGAVSTTNTGTSAHALDGSANGTLVTGKFGGAASFINVAPISDWWSNDATGANLSLFTLSLHVNSTNAANWQTFISIGSGADTFRLDLNGGHGGTSLYVDGTPGGQDPGAIDGSAAGAVTGGAWHHLAMVSNGSTIQSFVDGVSQGSVAYTGTGAINALQLAGLYGGGRRRQNTLMDDVAIYNEALSQSQITWLGSNVATANPIPEPSAAALLGLSGLALLLRRRK